MNVKDSIKRLSEKVRQLIVADTTIKSRYDQGESLELILSSDQWATTWVQNANNAELEVLTRVITCYAGTPFELETLLKTEAVKEALLGAEVRIAVARLRRCGILFAIRKAWGDQLLYLPVDTVGMWQSLLLPLQCKPLSEDASRGVLRSEYNFRLPLSIELLTAWYTVNRHPIPFTAKGTLNRPAINRMASELHLKQSELAFLSLAYPEHEYVPTQVALAIDIGLYNGVLYKAGNEIRIEDTGLKSWLSLGIIEANIQLQELAITRYASIDPGLHLVATAVASLPTMEWYMEESLLNSCHQEDKVHQWLGLLETFGWLDRGEYSGKAVFRKNVNLAAFSSTDSSEKGKIFIQPDGEIIVPPETGLIQRWMLEGIAERVASDYLFIYRLTRHACVKAFNSGHTLLGVVTFLEQHSMDGVPEPCRRALQDWFAPLGKVKLIEVMLLRVENPEVALLLKADSITAKLLLEQVGERDFIVETSAAKALKARLTLMGYPPTELPNGNSHSADRSEAAGETICSYKEERPGWIYKRNSLNLYEVDGTIPGKQELFPGMSSIPGSWITQIRAYHASTCKEIIRQAMDWQVSLQINHNGELRSYTPVRIEEGTSDWRVVGLMKQGGERVIIHSDEMKEIRIDLPSLVEFESI